MDQMPSRGITALLFLASAGMLTAQISPNSGSPPELYVLPMGTVGEAYNQQLTETFVASPAPVTWGIMSGSLPPGLTLNTITTAANTAITGTPTTPGLYSFVVEAQYNDSASILDTQPYAIDVVVGFSISTTSLPGATVGTQYSQQLQTVGAEGTVTWYLCPPDANCIPGGSPAPGLTLNSGTGVINGTPTTVGMFQFTVQAEYNDSATFMATRQLSINVTNPAPTCAATLGPATLPQGEIGVRYPATQFAVTGCAGTFSFTALQGATNNQNIDILPVGLSLTNGLLTGTPGQSGTFSFVIMASTASGPNQISAENQYTLVINSQPTITTASPLPSGAIGSLYSQQIAATGGVPPYTFSMDGNTPGITISPGGLLSGMPTATGTFLFTIGVTDSRGGWSSSPFQISFVVGTPEVEVSPLSLTFNADFQGSPPKSQPIAVTPASGTKPPVNFNVLIDNGQSSTAVRPRISMGPTSAVGENGQSTAAPSWISVSPTSASAPAGLVVSVNQGTLATGAYPARVRVVDSNNIPTDVSVTLNVNNTPAAHSVALHAALRRACSRSRNAGSGPAGIEHRRRYAGIQRFGNERKLLDLLHRHPLPAKPPSGEPVPLHLLVNTSGLAIGNYHDNIHIASAPAMQIYRSLCLSPRVVP